MKTIIPIRNEKQYSLKIVIEPWAEEIVLLSNQGCRVIFTANDSGAAPKFNIIYCDYGLIVWLEESGREIDFEIESYDS